MTRFFLLSALSLLLCCWMTKPEPKEVIDPAFIVPDDGSLADAFAAAAAREDTSARFVIFIRKGEYYLKGDSGATVNVEGTDHPSPITSLAAPNVTIIGEKMDSTVLWNKPVHEGIDITATLLLQPVSRRTIIMNLTIKNAYEYNEKEFAGRAVALQDKSSGTVCKYVKLLSHQDTYYSNNNQGVFLFEDCEFHGTMDFICGGGDATFLRCRMVLEDRKKADCITAPGVPRKNGYVFRDCVIEGPDSQARRYSLGRAWKDSCKCQYINTRMNILPRKEGWTVMRDYTIPSRMAEYGSMDISGVALDLTERRTTWGTDSTRVNLSPVLSAKEAEEL